MAQRVTGLGSFTPQIPAAVVDDLRNRIRSTRWVDTPEGLGWDAGVDVTYLRELLAYWADGFNFAAHQAQLAALPSRRATIDGTGVHFLHAPSTARTGEVRPVPLLLAHGWPDSAWRYRKVVPRLTAPGRAGTTGAALTFDLVVPDMPGFGFSDVPSGPTPDNRAVAGMWAELMTALGYDRFLVAGGDMGSHVARFLALDVPERVIAVHRTDAGLPVVDDPASLTQEERDWLDAAARWRAAEGGYAAIQSTKPQTLAVGLVDSPAGLAAWVVEKLRSWSDCDGDVESVFTRDEILALLTEHWAAGNVGAGVRAYRANAAIPRAQHARHVDVPSGFSVYAGDVVRPPRAWLDRTANTVYVTEPPRGGHFAPFEQPESYAHELRSFFGGF